MSDEQPTHSDLYSKIGSLQADMANVKTEVRDGRLENKNLFAAVNGRLDTLMQEREQRIGVRRLLATLHAVGGGGVVLAAQWAFKKFGG